MTPIVATSEYETRRIFPSRLYHLLKRSERLNAQSETKVRLLKPVSTVFCFQFNVITMKADEPRIHTGSGGIFYQELAHEQFTVMRT